jgi:ribonuclease HI
MMNQTKIYVDGACKKNGQAGSTCGIGIFFGKDDSRNISMRLKDVNQTNNVAELMAIFYALDICINTGDITNESFIIFSDSKYSINCVTDWIHNWKKNNWKTSNKEPVKNKEIIESIYEKMVKFKYLKFKYIKAHTNKTDDDSIGNRNADMLATCSLL